MYRETVSTRSFQIVSFEHATLRERRDEVTEEEPLEIRVNGEPLSVLMRTPGHDTELALGLLVSEGIVRSLADVASVDHCAEERVAAEHDESSVEEASRPESRDALAREGNVVDVHLASSAEKLLAAAKRTLITSSSCGLCGKTTIDSIAVKHAGFSTRPRLPVALLAKLPQALRVEQPDFDRSGGLHAAGVYDASLARVVVREDVGRHNAVDKCIGALLSLELLPLEGCTLVVSGRVSFEIVQKAVAAGIQTIVAVSAPSSLAIELARKMNLGLVAFARGDRANVYCGIVTGALE
ncbi:MAG: formate dehydrogenase accessory sulfurtransferase FdhD [Deltaproteobacteria bacterium]|nr:formate dehydrogenase accessory sulfurtransferase FdhD [Deltaproteobacteria bacterium]